MTIQDLFEEKLTEMMLCAEGPAIVFDREPVKGGERSNIPKSYGNRVYEFRARWDKAPSNTIRLKILREMQDELRQMTVKPMVGLHPGTLEWKVAIARDGRSDHTVAYAHKCSVKTVREVKAEIRERIIAALDSEEATVRKVADDFGISKSVVGRLRAAARYEHTFRPTPLT